MSPASPATPRAMPPTMAMPTSPSEKDRGDREQIGPAPQQKSLEAGAPGTLEGGVGLIKDCGGVSPFFIALSMRRSSSLAWVFWGSVCSSPRTYFRAFSYSCSQRERPHTTCSLPASPHPEPSILRWPQLKLIFLPHSCYSPTPQSRVHKQPSCGGVIS